MIGKELYSFLFFLLITIPIGQLIFDQCFDNYSDLITYLSIMIGFEITSLSIIFSSSLKKALYDTKDKMHRTKLHRLRNYYRFSIYIDLISIIVIFLIPQFKYDVSLEITITKSIIVLPIIYSSTYCLIKTCNDLMKIFVHPTNE